MSAGQPLWLKAVLRLERAIGTVEGVSRRCLHLFNLPAGTDLRRVREQLSRIERRLIALEDEQP